MPLLHLFESTLACLHRWKKPDVSIRDTEQHGMRGEELAFFYLRRRGYTVVARRWRAAPLRGEIDLIAWHGDTLCFVEVKTRSTRGSIAAEFAVDEEKQKMLRRMAATYIAHLPYKTDQSRITRRFDVIAVYLDSEPASVEHFPAAFV